jgi:hypothetical protein
VLLERRFVSVALGEVLVFVRLDPTTCSQSYLSPLPLNPIRLTLPGGSWPISGSAPPCLPLAHAAWITSN